MNSVLLNKEQVDKLIKLPETGMATNMLSFIYLVFQENPNIFSVGDELKLFLYC